MRSCIPQQLGNRCAGSHGPQCEFEYFRVPCLYQQFPTKASILSFLLQFVEVTSQAATEFFPVHALPTTLLHYLKVDGNADAKLRRLWSMDGMAKG